MILYPFFTFRAGLNIPWLLKQRLQLLPWLLKLELLQVCDCDNVDEQVAEAAINAFLRHKWYVTKELISLALCYKKLSDVELEKLGFSIYRKYQQHVAVIERNEGAPLTQRNLVFLR